MTAALGPHQSQHPVALLFIFKIIFLDSPLPEQHWHLPKWPNESSWLWVTPSLLAFSRKGTWVLSRGSICSWSLSIRALCHLVRSQLYAHILSSSRVGQTSKVTSGDYDWWNRHLHHQTPEWHTGIKKEERKKGPITEPGTWTRLSGYTVCRAQDKMKTQGPFFKKHEKV